ncbi:MAG: hypothetical protein C4289_10385 [Chloroflexota bacterium]
MLFWQHAPTRRALLTGLSSLGSGILTACRPGGGPPPAGPAAQLGGVPQRPAIIQWYQRRSNPALQTLESDFLAKEWEPRYPHLKIEIITEPGNNIEATEKLTVLIAGGTPPDLVDNPMSEDNLSPQGLTQPLDDLVAREKFDLSRYVKSHIERHARFRGKLYGIPYATGGNGYQMLYNRNLFAEQGLREPPAGWTSAWSWEEFRETLRRLTKRTGETITQAGLLNYGYYVLTIPIPWRAQWITEDLTTITCDSPEMIEAYSSFMDLVLKERTTGLSPGADLGTGDQFLAGRAAIRTIGSWQMGDYAKVTEAQLAWAFMPFPRGRVASPEFGPVLFSLATGARQREAAWFLLTWLVEGARFARYSGYIAPTKGDAEAQLKAQYQGLPGVRWEVVLGTYDIAEPLPAIRRHPRWVDMVKLTDAMWADIRTGNQGVAAALRDLKPKLQAIVDDYARSQR